MIINRVTYCTIDQVYMDYAVKSLIYSRLCITQTAGDQKIVRVIGNFELDDVF